MAKGTKGAAASPEAATSAKDAGRKARRLERRLAKVREIEATRTRQLEKARARRIELESLVADLAKDAVSGADPTVDPTAVGMADPHAYCLRERRTVTIADPQATVMRNGRAALAGTCPSCGARVVTTSRAAMGAVTGSA